MSMLLCVVCDTLFDVSEQVEAQYDPPVCEDCLLGEVEEQKQQWWADLDRDEQAIEDFCEDKL